MPSRRLDKTSVDYVAIALAPGLIMGLVGSLVFFLLEVFYGGEHGVRLSCILFLFVFAVVLIARISITEGSAHAGVYGAVLALVTALAMIRLVDQPLVGCLLLAVIWWCAHKLTWDCTLIDEQEEDSGQGVLESAGLDYEASARDADIATDDRRQLDRALEKTSGSWWRALVAGLVEQDRRPHAPGVWVIYFSLAALPLFGLGQLLVPVSHAGRRDYAFGLLCLYLACGLALLLVTSFLGLRRYLRQRRLEMPATMTGAWMGAGVGMIVVLLAVAAVLPSPGGAAQWKLPDSFSLSSPQRAPSRAAPLREDGAEGEGADSRSTDPSADETSDDVDEDSSAEEPSGADDNATDAQGDSPSGSGGQGDSKTDGGDQRSSQSHDDSTSDRQSNTDPQPDEEPTDERPNDDEPDKQSGGTGKPQQGSQSKTGGQPSQPQSSSQPPSSGNRFSLPPLAGSWGQWLKWLFYLVLAVVGIYMCVRHWDQVRGWITQLVNELRGIFSGLFGRRGAKPKDEPAAEAPPARPFAMFSDPFQDGTAAGRSADELVRYSFAALEAWAIEYGGGRPPEWTPLELAHHLAREHPHLADTAGPLASLYARLAYAGQSLSPECVGKVRKFWKRLGEREVAAVSQEVV